MNATHEEAVRMVGAYKTTAWRADELKDLASKRVNLIKLVPSLSRDANEECY